LAARIGTPIQATGDGRIEIIGSQNGYGNMIKIKHNKSFSTIYGHMLKFQKGLSRGSYVRRGQVIGYVGQTGLASGPHCHYEVHVNNQARNPATVSLPRGEPVNRRELARFKANTNSLLAQLKLHETKPTQLAKK
jgi:murein DD-endopeptidase MepM/ murein hydrolase activator NlpD